MHLKRLGAAFAAALLCALAAVPAMAQPAVNAPAGAYVPSVAIGFGTLNMAAGYTAVDATHPLPVTCTGCSGGGGGSGGAVTAVSGAFASGSLVDIGVTNTDLGAPGATACSTDNGSCSLNALIERNNQRLTSAITALGSPMQANGAATTATSASVPVTLTSATTSYQVLASNTSRKGGVCQQSALATGQIYWNYGAAASTTAFMFTTNPGGSVPLSIQNGQPIQQALYAYDTVAGDQVSCFEAQ